MLRLVPLLAASLLVASCGKSDHGHGEGGHQMPPPPVGVAQPIARVLPVTRELTGRIEAVQTVELKPRISGVVEQVLVADGAEVKAGDRILIIDEKPQRANLARAQAELARAESVSNQAKVQFERSKRLVADKVVSAQQYDDQEAAVKTAEAQIAAARAALITAQLDVDYSTVTAPIDGRIGQVLTTPGNLVQGGGPVPATLLATIVTADPVYAVFDLDEATWQRVGQRLRAVGGSQADAVPVKVGLTGETGFPHVGVVAWADNQIDSASGSIRIRARLPNPYRSLTPGAFARVQLELEAPRPVLLVHERVVQAQMTTRYVYTVDEKGITAIRPVRLGATVDQLRVVESGLTGNERIAVNNLSKIFFPGAAVAAEGASMLTLENDAAPAGAPGAQGGPGAESAASAEGGAEPAPAAKAAPGSEGTKP